MFAYYSLILTISIPVTIKWYLIVLWFAFFWWLMILNIFSWRIDHFYIFGEFYSCLPIFKWNICSLLMSYKSSLYIHINSYLINDWQIFLPIVYIIFSLCWPSRHKVFNFDETCLYLFPFVSSSFLISYVRSFCQIWGHIYPFVFSKSFIV